MPPSPPDPMPLDAARAVARAQRELYDVKRRGTDVLAAAVTDVETLVRERATERDREALALVDRLQTLASEQRDDCAVLARARHGASPGVRPTMRERTHVPDDVRGYVDGLTRGVSWASLIPLETLGIVPPEPVATDPEPWHASRARGPLEGPEYAGVRAADRRAAAAARGGRDPRL